MRLPALQTMLIIPILFVVLLPINEAFSNDGFLSQGGGGVKLMSGEHIQIQMVRELVEIELGERGADVRCEFVFHNHGPETEVLMGFPGRYSLEGEGGNRACPVK